MTAWSIRSISAKGMQLLLKMRFILIGLLIVSLGILTGNSIDSIEAGELAVSIVTVLALFVIAMREPLDALVIWVFFVPFLESVINVSLGAGIPDLSFSRFLIAFIGIAILAKGAIGQRRISRIGLVEICILATTIGIMIAAPNSISPKPTGVIQIALSLYLTPLISYFFAKNLIRDHDDLVKVFMAIALLGFVSGTYAAYENATGNILFVPRATPLADLELYRTDLGIRMILGIFGSTGTIARVLVFSIPVTFYLFLEANTHRIPRILLGVMLLAQFYGSIIAMSRTPWYALLIALFVMQFLYPKFRKAFVVIAFLAAIVLAATWDQVTESSVAARIGDENSTLEGRQGRWVAGLSMWQAKPVRGWGFGRYVQESGRFRTDGSQINLTAIENDYLNILVSAGLIGFVPYALALLSPLAISVRLLWTLARKKRPPSDPIRLNPNDSSRRGAYHHASFVQQGSFIRRETIAVYWAVLICFAVCGYTAAVNSASLRLIVFTVAGAVIGTHEHLLAKNVRPSWHHADARREAPSIARKA